MQLLQSILITLWVPFACASAQDQSAPEANTAAAGNVGADKGDRKKSTLQPAGVLRNRLVLPPAARATEVWIKRLEVRTPESIALLRLLASKHSPQGQGIASGRDDLAAAVEAPDPVSSSPKTRTYTSIDFGPLAGAEELAPRPRHEAEMLSLAETELNPLPSHALGPGETDHGRAALRQAARLQDTASSRWSDAWPERSSGQVDSHRATPGRVAAPSYSETIADVHASSAAARNRRKVRSAPTSRDTAPAATIQPRRQVRPTPDANRAANAPAFTNRGANWIRPGQVDPRSIDRPGARQQAEYRGTDTDDDARENQRRIRSFRYYQLPALSRAPTVHGPHPARFISLLAPKHDIDHTTQARHFDTGQPSKFAGRHDKDERSDFARPNAEIRSGNRVKFLDGDRQETSGYARRVTPTEYDRSRRRTLQNLALMPGSSLRPLRPRLPLTFGQIQRNLDDLILPNPKIQMYRFPYTPKVRLDPYHEDTDDVGDAAKVDRPELDDAGVRPVYRAELVRMYPARTEQPSLEQKAQQRRKPRPRRRKSGCSTCP